MTYMPIQSCRSISQLLVRRVTCQRGLIGGLRSADQQAEPRVCNTIADFRQSRSLDTCRRHLSADGPLDGNRTPLRTRQREQRATGLMSRSLHKLIRRLRALPYESSVGFVPTMGALHEGHVDLFRRARAECDVVVGSVFVNPAQFAPHEDLDRYPRQLEQDLELLATEELVDLLFAPTRSEMYSPSHRIYVDPLGFDDLPEGVARPGFFRGVATVVTKLLNVVQPDRVYFGQKDALQCVLINRLVEDLNIPVKVIICETRREPDGLAMSSRNTYMSPAERAAAPVVYLALKAAVDGRNKATEAGRDASRTELVEASEAILAAEPLVSSVDYFSVGCPVTMEELDTVGKAGAIVSVAVRVGSVRLIDNVVLPPT